MKKTVSAAIGSTNFIIDEDAYSRLDSYLKAFRSRLQGGADNQEVMADLENRIAELLSASLNGERRVVDIRLIDDVIARIGMPDGSTFTSASPGGESSSSSVFTDPAVHKLFRDPDHRSIGGVCSGLAAYFNIDVTLVRIIFLLLLLVIGGGLWIYLVLWIIVPKAKTPTEKCQLRGLEPTYDNLSKFTVSQ